MMGAVWLSREKEEIKVKKKKKKMKEEQNHIFKNLIFMRNKDKK